MNPSANSSANVPALMRELGLDRDNFRVLGLLPLVFVAWADGTLQRAEWSLIRRVARDKGWLAGTGADLLERWLEEPPSEDYVRNGLALLKALASQRHGLGNAITADTLNQLLVLCRDVAEAAGGMWGFAESISGEEEGALAAIARAFDIGGADTWRRIVTETESREATEVPGPRGHALLGALPALIKDPLALLMECMREHGDVARLRIPGADWYVITHPEHVKHVLVTHSRNYLRGKSFERFRAIFGDSIVTADGEPWRHRRRLGQPAFHHEAVARMCPMIRSCTRDMVEAWARRDDPEAPLDLEDAMQNLAFRIIGHVLFGTDLQAEESQAFSDALAVTLEYAAGATNPFRLPTAIPTPTNVRYRRAIQLFDATVKDMLEKRRSSAEQPHDLMTMLLTTVDPETGEGLAHEYLRGEMLSYLTAGHETVATALTWVFYLLSRHPLVARKLDDEIRAVLGDEPASFGKLDELVYTEQVLMETLRLYPPVFMLTREVQSEDRLGEYTIPAKSWVLLAPYLTHRRPDLWDNPEGFDPERFAPGAHAARAALSHFPFFAGPHKCIGEGLAYAEMKIVLATVLQRCRLDLVAGFTPVPGPHVTLRTRDGMKMQPRWR